MKLRFKISQFNRHIGLLMSEDKEFNQVNSFTLIILNMEIKTQS